MKEGVGEGEEVGGGDGPQGGQVEAERRKERRLFTCLAVSEPLLYMF